MTEINIHPSMLRTISRHLAWHAQFTLPPETPKRRATKKRKKK